MNPQESSEKTEADGQRGRSDSRKRTLKSDHDRLINVALFIVGALLSIWWGTMRLSLVILIAGVALVTVAGVRAWIHYQERSRSVSRHRY